MAFDPISILVAGVAAAGAAVHGSPLPPPVADVATNVVAAVEYAAPEWESQLAPHIEQLPANISAQVEQLLPSEETLPAIPAPVAPVESIESVPAPAPAPVAVAPMVAPVVLAGPGSSAPSAVPPLTSLIPGLSIVPQLVFDPNIPRDVEVARKVIEAALTALGLPYQWGGGALDGPTMGDGTGGATAGYDCSGLVRFAVFQATGKELPRTSQIQFTVGTQISWDSAQPGDLVFGNWQADGANHVAIYLGGGRMIEAPQTGQLVQISDVRSDMVPVRLF
ncbi:MULTISPECIES: C40 family peptidase [Rhodococcus erythropolis group]|uniref:C40 family peptidase n=1 Tax=Rhodococcus erythropolis group TaxID=2840174 RepID=UPI001C5FEC6A|nr:MULTISPECIES: NlpC/P60 family protein [Rhodococcus erythropolis group]MBW4818345.1 C40 family peptidase [Rhodococcus qingshengii]MBY6389470.1 C40 family peptidase [Rhodococcus erythropolis]